MESELLKTFHRLMLEQNRLARLQFGPLSGDQAVKAIYDAQVENHEAIYKRFTKKLRALEENAARWEKFKKLNESYFLQTITVYHPERPGIQMTHRDITQREIDKNTGVVRYKSGKDLDEAIDQYEI